MFQHDTYQTVVSEDNYKSLDDLYRLESEKQHNKRNKLYERFERQFSESHLVNLFILEPQFRCENDPFFYIWDYAILTKKEELVAFVDIYDGYFYPYKCDFDDLYKPLLEDGCSLNEVLTEGIDMLRDQCSYAIPSFIIDADHFIDSLDFIIQCIYPNYDQYLEDMFKLARSGPFPFPSYSEEELVKSYKELLRVDCNNKHNENIALNTRIGDKLIQHFHQSIWYAHREGEISPYEAWQDDEIIRKVIKNRVIFQKYISRNKVMQGLNIMKIAPKISIFSAARAKLIINKYLNEFDVIFDPFSGYSGRLLGTISLGKKYIGQDINHTHIEESLNLIMFLRNHFVNIDAKLKCKNIFKSSGQYPCLFTCSPYANKEIWKDTPESSLTCDQWIDECLERFDCKRYVFVVDETTKYKDNIVDVLNNKSHFGLNNEYIIKIDK